MLLIGLCGNCKEKDVRQYHVYNDQQKGEELMANRQNQMWQM